MSMEPETAQIDRMPPQDTQAEQCALGGMLLSTDAITDVTGILNARDFYRPAHETIYRAILDLHERGEPADPITVAAELTKRGELTKIGGNSYLHQLVQVVPTAANAAYYAEIVHQEATWRALVQIGTQIAQMGYARDGDPEEARDQAEVLLHSLGRNASIEKPYKSLGEILELTYDDLESDEQGVPTGITDLDNLTNGLQSEQLIVVGARPAVGKSVFAEGMALHPAVKHQIPTAFFSLEMSDTELGQRALASQAQVALHHLRTRQLTEVDWTKLARTTPALTEAPAYFDSTPTASAAQICSNARRMHRELGIGLVVIDYLQLTTGDLTGRAAENRQREIAETSRKFKLLAKELKIPVVLLSQLNRGPEQRQDKKPMVSDLRESGAIEQDADVVILLHREDVYEKESPRAGEMDIIVGKHRNGPTATITAAFQGHYSSVVDMAST